MLKGCISFAIKTTLITFLLMFLLILAIMVRYDISYDFVMHGSDTEIEAELSKFLDPKSFMSELIDCFPSEFHDLLGFFDYVKDINTIDGATQTNVDNAQYEVLASLFLALCAFLFHKIVLFIYGFIRKIADLLGKKGLISFFGEMVSMAQIAYVGTIIIVLMRDFILEKIFYKSPVLLFVVLALALIVLTVIENYLFGGKGKRVTDIEKLAYDMLFSASAILFTVAALVAATVYSNGGGINPVAAFWTIVSLALVCAVAARKEMLRMKEKSII